MKLATYKDGSRDGQLLVVSRDLHWAHYATGMAGTLQQVLDDWNFVAPQLQALYVQLNQGRARHAFPFEPQRCMAPLPRAVQHLSALAYPEHLALAGLPGPALVQRSGDAWCGPCDEVTVADDAWCVDFGAEWMVITGDVPQGVTAEDAVGRVRLVMAGNAITLQRGPGGAALGHVATACSPVAVTPDELGAAWWSGGTTLHLQTAWNGRKVGLCDLGEMSPAWGAWLQSVAQVRALQAGTVLAAGPVCSRRQGSEPPWEWPRGFHSLVQKRAMELQRDGQVLTGFLRPGDTIRVEVRGKDGANVFGTIEHAVVPIE